MATAQAKTMLYRFKDITVVPTAKDLVDIVLSRTQRRTPTQVHPQFKISRIRSFYMRKIKYCMQTFHDKFTAMLMEFPRLDDIHPFYSDLCNVLYDRDHYKLALGQVNTVRGIVDSVAKDYVRLLKYADSAYKAKMLKRAGLGRMCTAVRKLADSLKYLEEVRQHLSRLPSINPSTRTLILTGYPNVGKSSFINSVSHANVEVQPYAFTTKSLFVGHFDYGYSRWQVIDTPGILDQPLANRNTIELTAITALAHIQAAVLFFVDISEQCGFSIECQVSLFHSLKVLFKNKPLVIVLNKIDVMPYDSLPEESKALIEGMSEGLDDVVTLQTSCLVSLGIDDAKNKACEALLQRRVESKVKSHRVDIIGSRLHVTDVTPPPDRPPCIPPGVASRRSKAAEGIKLAKDAEEEQGGPGVYSVDLKENWLLENPDWRYDAIPEFFDGKNVMDFIDADVEKKLLELEREEEQHLALGDREMIDQQDWLETKQQLQTLHQKIQDKRLQNRLRKAKNHVPLPRRVGAMDGLEAERRLKDIGYEVDTGLEVPVINQKDRGWARRRADDDVSSQSSGMSDIEEDDEDSEGDGSDLEMTGQKRKRRASSATVDTAMKTAGDSTDARVSMARKLRRLSLARTVTVPRSLSLTSGRFVAKAQERARSLSTNRIVAGLPDATNRAKAEKVKRAARKGMIRLQRAGEADRFIGTKMPKHLFSGKRGIGKTDRR